MYMYMQSPTHAISSEANFDVRLDVGAMTRRVLVPLHFCPSNDDQTPR